MNRVIIRLLFLFGLFRELHGVFKFELGTEAYGCPAASFNHHAIKDSKLKSTTHVKSIFFLKGPF